MEIIGGYSVVRRLGTGQRSEVWLGRAVLQGLPGALPTPASQQSRELVAVKVYRPDTDPDAIDREFRALATVSSRYIIPILDAATTSGGSACLVLPRLDSGGVSRLLAARHSLSPGEIVTLIVPLGRAVAALHDQGVTHGGLQASKVMFTEEGAPMILGGAEMSIHSSPPSRARLRDGAEFSRDRHQLRALAARVIARSDDPDCVNDLGMWVESESWNDPDFASELVHRAFAVAPPEPLVLPWVRDEGALAHMTPDGVHPASESRRRSNVTASGGSGAARGVTRLLSRLRMHRESAAPRISALVAGVRPRYRVLAVVGGVLAVAALTLMQTPPLPPDSGLAVVTNDDSVHQAVPPPEVSEAAEQRHTPTENAGHGGVGDASVEMDDPAAATRILLALREECHAAGSIPCLAGAVQPDSAAWSEDVARLAAVADGRAAYAPFWSEELSVSVVDVMGGVVLLSIDVDEQRASGIETPEMRPASVLVVRTEAGWRIREMFPG